MNSKPLTDAQAAEILINDRRIVEVVPVPSCGIMPDQLRSAVQFAEHSGRIAMLVCENCGPKDRYLVIRTIDLPMLLLRFQELLLDCCQ